MRFVCVSRSVVDLTTAEENSRLVAKTVAGWINGTPVDLRKKTPVRKETADASETVETAMIV